MANKIKGIKFKKNNLEEIKVDFFNEKNNIKYRGCLIYGENGAGKSTIAQAFYDYKNNNLNSYDYINLYDFNYNTLEKENLDIKNIFVFNEKFIDNNINVTDDGINSIVILGENVNIDKEMHKLIDDNEDLSHELEGLKKKLERFNNKDNKDSPSHYFNKIKNYLQEDDSWADIDKILKGNSVKSSVSKDIIIEISTIDTNGKKEEEITKNFKSKYESFNNTKNKAPIVKDYMNNLPEIDDQIIINLLQKKIISYKKNETISKIINFIEKNPKINIDNINKYFSDDKNNICPFCFRAFDESYRKDLISSIKQICNEDYKNHITELKNIREELTELKFNNIKLNSLNEDILITKIENLILKINNKINTYSNSIDNKIRNIYIPLQVTPLGITKDISQLKEYLAQLDEKIDIFNEAISKRDQLKIELIDLNKKVYYFKIKDDYDLYLNKQEIEESERNYIKDKEKEFNKNDTKIKELNARKKNITIAIDKINNELKYIFFDKNRLEIEVQNNKYFLKCRGKNLKPHDLSTGERNIIALCYFFAQIIENKNSSDIKDGDFFIILDDPISSFDSERQIGVFSYLKKKLSEIILKDNKSKLIIFSHNLEVISRFKKVFEEINEQSDKNFLLKHHFIKELKNGILKNIKYYNKYNRLINEVYDYATENNQNDENIGNIMRKLLEAFGTFEYKKGISEISTNKDILKSINDNQYRDYFENLMYRLVLNEESHTQDFIKNLSFLDFSLKIKRSEKIQTAKDILCFMHILNPLHVKFQLQHKTDAIKNIRKWCKEIKERI
ncbi:AAA family ATPase [uncultured Anaerofustis sp.]|uniref:AAA family ATPase n=1 Tax=uncultured Anaerofustis sp. TaxID=904996 RepID=UPI0025DDA6DC|nr:AAA family ATPase [uncultured Anaerofustis sp.]